ncbi:MAG: TolC family protein [Sphingomonadales bacterium]|nr:TolC family protein [Sphingomonadales bacterium]MDE2171016.1 TolC family protein [Sphingomonadales bacterium]
MNNHSSRQRDVALIGMLAATMLAGPALADPAPPFAQLLRQAQQAPHVEALQSDVERAQGLAVQARARPNPTVSLYGENFAGSAPYNGFGGTQTTFQVNQPLELGGKRAARIEAGQAGVIAAQLRSQEGRLTFAFDLARAYAAVEVADKRIELAEDEVEEATADLALARALVASGKEARLRSLQAETELNTLQADLVVTQANRKAALLRLSALAGVETPFTALGESLLDRQTARSAMGPIDPMQTAMVRVAEAEGDAARRRVTLQRKAAIPDVTLQFGVRRLEQERSNTLVAGISVPLHIFDRNRGNIAAAQAEERGAQARLADAKLEARAEIEAGQALLEAADARVQATVKTLATAQETYRLARIAYEAGKSPLIELLASRHGLGIARGVRLDAVAASLDARANLARLKGLTITGEPVQ